MPPLLMLGRFGFIITTFSFLCPQLQGKFIKVFEKLGQNQSIAHKTHLATSQNNLGVLLRNIGAFDEALQFSNAAVETRRQFLREGDDSPDRESSIVHALINRGSVLLELGRVVEAESDWREALGICSGSDEIQSGEYDSNRAAILHNLAILLKQTRRLEEAEDTCENAIIIQRRLPAPSNMEDLAGALITKGLILQDLDRLSEAELTFREALEICDILVQSELPDYLLIQASVQNNLSSLLRRVGRLDEAEATANAAARTYQQLSENSSVYQSALAGVHVTLGNLYHTRAISSSSDEATEWLLKAEAAFRVCIESRLKMERGGFNPYESDIANALNNLGLVLADLYPQELERAEEVYRQGWEIYQRIDIPDDKARLLSNWGELLIQQENRRAEGIELLQEAMASVERLRSEVFSVARQQQIVSDNFRIYENLLIALLQEERGNEAMELAEKSRNRTLLDLMTSRDLVPAHAPADLVARYKSARDQVRALQVDSSRTTQNSPLVGPGGNRKANRLEASYLEYNQLKAELEKYEPDFRFGAESLDVPGIIDLAIQSTKILISFRVTEAGTYVFIAFPNGEATIVPILDFTTRELDDLIESYGEGPDGERTEPLGGWMQGYRANRYGISAVAELTAELRKAVLAGDFVDSSRLAEAKAVRESAHDFWLGTIYYVLGALQYQLMRHIQLVLYDTPWRDLVLIPNRALAVLPLHACWWFEEEGERRYWLDEFTISYAPSLTIYKHCLEKERGRGREKLLGIANPTGDLRFAGWECREIEKLLGQGNCKMYHKRAATREVVEAEMRRDDRNLVHFSCHGRYNMDSPMSSSLFLADKSLTLGDIFQHVSLPSAWLVVLSACETGLTDFSQISDEQYGLSTGFLHAGTPTVFSSLWPVNDGRTALLMILMYRILVSHPELEKAQVLKQAQLWMRDLTKDEAKVLLAEFPESVEAQALLKDLENCQVERPYEHPYNWAAFQCVGA